MNEIYINYLDSQNIQGTNIIQVTINRLYKPFIYMYETQLYKLLEEKIPTEDFLDQLKTHIEYCYIDLGTAGLLTNQTNNETLSLIFILAVYAPMLRKLKNLSKFYCYVKNNKSLFDKSQETNSYSVLSNCEFNNMFNIHLTNMEKFVNNTKEKHLKFVMGQLLGFHRIPSFYKNIEVKYLETNNDCFCEICKKIDTDLQNALRMEIAPFKIKIGHLLL